jgi:hypothetical protein
MENLTIVGISAEIRAKHFSNISQKRYRWDNLYDELSFHL